MAGKVQSEMSTRVSLDTLSAVGSLKGLTDAVKASTNSWKANVAMLSSTGDRMGAAQAKVDGLSESIERQGAKINELKSRQEGLDVTTQSGAEQFQKLQRQIETATRQMASMESQQTRAKSSLGYYTSGLADLQRGYQTAQRASEAYVSRLQAEGREEEANKAKMSGLKQSLANLSSQYEKQESELKRIASESGATSEAYLKQKTRLDQTGTAVAETRSKINELNSAMNKRPSGFMSGVREKLDSVSDKADKTSHIFGKIFGAQIAANAVTGALASIQARFTELIGSVVQYNDKQQVMNSTWNTLTGSASKGKAMVDMGNQLASAYNQDINVVDELNQQFYHVLDAKGPTEQLTKSVLTMSDTLGLSADNTERLGTNFTHMMSSGKVQLGDFNMINDQLPMFAGRMLDYEKKVQNNSNLTMSQLRDQMSAGKISAQDAENVMNELGKKYQSASENLMKTIPGMERSIKTQMPGLLDQIYKPIANMQNPLLGSITKWIGDSSTKKAFAGVGDALKMQIQDITKAFGGSKIDVTGGLDKMMLNLQTAIDKVGASVVAHKSDIKDFISSFKSGSATSLKIFVDVLKDMATVMKPALDLMAKFPKTTASIITGGLLASKAIAGMSLAFRGLDIVKNIGTLFGKFLDIVSFGKFTKIAQGIKDFTAATKGATLAEKAQLAVETVMKAMNPFGWVTLGIAALAALTAGFVALYKHNAKFRAFINGLVKSAQQLYKGVTKWFSQTWSNIKKGASKSWKNTKKAFSSGWNSAVKTTQNGYKSTVRWFSNLWSDTKKGVQNSWNDTKNKFSAGWNDTKKLTQSGANWVGNRWNQLKNDTGKIANAMKNSNNATFRNGYNTLNSYTQAWHDIMTGKWNKVGGDIRNTTNNLFKTVKSAFSGAYNWLNNLTGGRLGDILHTFSSIFGKIVGVIKGAFKGIHDGFVDIVRGIIKPFNTMLGGLKKGINWVLDKVGASKIKGDWSVPLPGYATGTKGGVLHDQLAMVNDGKGSKYREMYHTPDGEVGMFPAMRNMIVPLKAGTEILDADSSARLAKLMGLQKYASGSIGSFFSSIFDKGKDLLEDTDKILAHPIDFLQSVFSKFVSGISSSAGIATDIITNFPSTVAKSAVNWVKKLFSDFGGGGANPSGSGVMRWKSDVIKALKMNGFDATDYQVNAWLKVIQRESNGNPHAINLWDSNAKAGIPSKGLVQTIQPTFDANAFPGHKDVWNGLDDLLAGIHYMKARYGSGTSAFARVSGPMGYANGGIVSTEGLYTLAEGNRPEFIIPTDSSKRNRAVELLNQAKTAVTGTGLSDETNAKLETIIEQQQQLINIVVALLKVNPEVVIDGDALIGRLYSRIDQAGYNASAKVQRNTWG